MIVLLVEDDDDVRRVLELALASEFDLRICRTGTAGLEALRTERVDVLLTDLDLPGVSGEALAAAAKTAAATGPGRRHVRRSGPPGGLPADGRCRDREAVSAVRPARGLRRATRWGQSSGPGGLTARAALGMAVLASIACSRR
jgi:CheY-like chemotaxis protein